MAFLYVFWVSGVICLPRREKASLNKCKQNFGSNSTHERLSVSSFSARLVCAKICEWAIIIWCLRQLRSSGLDGSELGKNIWFGWGSISSCGVGFDCHWGFMLLCWHGGQVQKSFSASSIRNICRSEMQYMIQIASGCLCAHICSSSWWTSDCWSLVVQFQFSMDSVSVLLDTLLLHYWLHIISPWSLCTPHCIWQVSLLLLACTFGPDFHSCFNYLRVSSLQYFHSDFTLSPHPNSILLGLVVEVSFLNDILWVELFLLASVHISKYAWLSASTHISMCAISKCTCQQVCLSASVHIIKCVCQQVCILACSVPKSCCHLSDKWTLDGLCFSHFGLPVWCFSLHNGTLGQYLPVHPLCVHPLHVCPLRVCPLPVRPLPVCHLSDWTLAHCLTSWDPVSVVSSSLLSFH